MKSTVAVAARVHAMASRALTVASPLSTQTLVVALIALIIPSFIGMLEDGVIAAVTWGGLVIVVVTIGLVKSITEVLSEVVDVSWIGVVVSELTIGVI